MRSIRAEGLLRLGMTMAERGRLHAAGFGEGEGEGEDGGEWSGAEGEGEGGEGGVWHGHEGWGRAVESVAALSLRDDVDYSRPVAAVSFSLLSIGDDQALVQNADLDVKQRMYSQTTLDSEHSQGSHQPPDVPYHSHPHPHTGLHQVSTSDASAS